MPAVLGRRYVRPQLVRNPQEPSGPTYNDTASGTIGLAEVRVESYELSVRVAQEIGTIALSGTRTESHAHSAECLATGGYGEGIYGEALYGGDAPSECIYVGAILLSGTMSESYEPPGGTTNVTRPRVGYGN